jgi:hypothetical protein
MNPNDNWIAEQARLIDLEDGFGPNYPTKVKNTSTADESEAAAA